MSMLNASQLRLINIACVFGTLAALSNCSADGSEPAKLPANGGSNSGKAGAPNASGGVSTGSGGTQTSGGTSSQGGAGNNESGTGGSGGTGTSGTGGVAGSSASNGIRSPYCASGPYSTDSPLPSTKTAKVIKLTGAKTGHFNIAEGTLWVAELGALLFSDAEAGPSPPPSTMYRLTPPGTIDVFIADSGSNGLAITPDGKTVIAATHDNGSVSTYALSNKQRGVLAERYNGAPFNSPNDVAVRADGNVYFSDPDYQKGDRQAQGDVTGVYWISTSKEVKLIDGSRDNPNGVTLAPDGETLYVGAADNRIKKHAVQADGSVGAGANFANANGPDGMGMDCAGNLYVAQSGGGGVAVYRPDGQSWGSISAGSFTTNVAFGGSERKTLYITSGQYGDMTLYSIELNISGIPF